MRFLLKILSLGGSEDGRLLASAAQDGSIRVWSYDRLTSGSLELKGHRSAALIAWSSSSLYSASLDGTVRRWDVIKGEELIGVLLGSECLCIACHEECIVVGTKDNRVHALNPMDLSVIWTKSFVFEVNDILLRNGEVILACGDGRLRVYNPSMDDLTACVHAHPASLYCLAKGKSDRIAVGAADAIISLWNPLDWCAEQVNYHLEWPVRSMAWNPKGTLLACASDDPFIEVIGGQRISAPGVTAVTWRGNRQLVYGQQDGKDSLLVFHDT